MVKVAAVRVVVLTTASVTGRVDWLLFSLVRGVVSVLSNVRSILMRVALALTVLWVLLRVSDTASLVTGVRSVVYRVSIMT